jgi:hypothetical protein
MNTFSLLIFTASSGAPDSFENARGRIMAVRTKGEQGSLRGLWIKVPPPFALIPDWRLCAPTGYLLFLEFFGCMVLVEFFSTIRLTVVCIECVTLACFQNFVKPLLVKMINLSVFWLKNVSIFSVFCNIL